MPDLTLPVIQYLPMLELTWNGEVRARYVRAQNDLTIEGEVYTAMPEMEIRMQAQGGDVADKPVEVMVRLDADPFWKLIISEHAEIKVAIAEADAASPTDSRTLVYTGTLVKTTARPNGKTRLMKLELWGAKAFFRDVPLGLKCTDRCPWVYGDRVCRANPTTVQAEVSSIAGTTINFTSLPSDSAKGGWAAGRYTRGYVEFEGLRIMILEHVIGIGQLILAKAPPNIPGYSWDGETIDVTEGCDKTIPACTAHGRTEAFGGAGLAMPTYDPRTEASPTG